jgi:hypothetical protein
MGRRSLSHKGGGVMSRRHQTQADNRRGALILVGCVGVLATVGSLLWASKPAARDKDTHCKAGLAKQHTVVIVDASDGYGRAQVATLQAALLKLAADLPEDDRLSLYLFAGTGRRTAPVAGFDRCKLDDGSTATGLTSNTRQIRQRHELQWQAPLARVLTGLPKTASHPQTELVQYVADVAGLLPYLRKGERTHLKIFSNLEENGSVSFYDKKPALSAAEFASFFKRSVKDRLQGLTVDLVYLPAPKTTPDLTRRTKAAWAQALTASGIPFTLRDL